VLIILAFAPWAITLAIGATGFVNLRTHWAIPIGFTFPLLWLSNLVAANEPDMARLTRGALTAFVVWLVLVFVLAPFYAWQQAITGPENFYRPRAEAAQALLAEWERRVQGQKLTWVGGEWPENALLAFYGDYGIRAVHGFPGEFPATLIPHESWQSQAGLILCRLEQTEKPRTHDCTRRALAWFARHGQEPEIMEITVTRTGLRFPLSRPFRCRAFPYLPPSRE
jgi:hypothetical protein|tara:strand:+ start:15052 stop:15726 length:675 start_codon:yes stop_codon:yes gene_type:complete